MIEFQNKLLVTGRIIQEVEARYTIQVLVKMILL